MSEDSATYKLSELECNDGTVKVKQVPPPTTDATIPGGGRRGLKTKTLRRMLKKAGLKVSGKKSTMTKRAKKAHLVRGGGLSVAENLVLTRYHDDQFSHGVLVDWDAANAIADTLIGEYDIRTPNKETGVGTLSGGNQQKVIVARELSRDLRLTIAAQPTRGVDVGSIEYIHSRIVKERDAGTAVLIVSTELDEVMALSDRLLVMYRGRVVAELDPKKVTPMEVGLYMAGSRPNSAVTA